MNAPENASDRRAREMCRLALARLARDPDGVRARARALVELWERKATCHPWYAARWRALLDSPSDALGGVLMADTDEGRMLRANNPFAGIFTREERRLIQKAGREAVGEGRREA